MHYTSNEYDQMAPSVRILLCVYAQFVIIISGSSLEDIHQKYLMHNFKRIFESVDQKRIPELIGFVARALQA